MFLFLLILLLNIGCISTSVLTQDTYIPPNRAIKARQKLHSAGESANKNYYIVKRHDTLFSIARKLNLSVRELAEVNNMKKDRIIVTGTKLIVPFYTNTRTLKERENKVLFLWPVQGRIISHFGENTGNKKNKGIEIETTRNASVHASATGQVTFSSYIKGYGKTIIIRHHNDTSTVYTNLSVISVKEDGYVKRGQIIGQVGKDLRRGISVLHFEIRKGYKAKNPLAYLRS